MTTGPDEAVTREAVRDLVARYNLYGDAGRSDDVAGLFARDAVLEYREGDVVERFTGRPEIASFLERVKGLWLAESRAARVSPKVFHSVGTHVVDVLDEAHATGQAYVTLVRFDGLAEWGRYRDEYVRSDGRWFFASRQVSLEGRVQGSSLARRTS